MPGKKPRFSIARLMVIISILAAECAILRAGWGTICFAATIMVLPLLNFMFLGVAKLRTGHQARPFWIGFEVVGVTLVGLIYFLQWYDWETLIQPILWLYENGLSKENSPEHLTIACACVVVMYGLPQLLAASIAGWLSARYQIVRRSRASDAEELTAKDDTKEATRGLPTFADNPRPAVGS